MQNTAAGYQRARDRLSLGAGSKEHENADAAPFQPHFLQQEMIFAHGETWPPLRGDHLYKAGLAFV